MSNPTQANRPISVSTPLGTDVLLLRNFTFREELGRPFAMDLEMQSTDANIDFQKVIGTNFTVTVNLPTYQKRYFTGTVATFQQTGFTGGLANYRAMVIPWLGLLNQTSDCQTFQNLSIPGIIQQVFQDFGFSDVRNALTATYPVVPYCVQYDETAFNFVSRLMEFAGIYYYFEHTQEKDTMVLCDAGTVPVAFPGYETIPYSAEKFVLHAPQHIYEWVMTQEVKPQTVYLDDYNYTSPKTDLLESGQISQTYTNGQFSRFDYPGNYQTTDEGQALATARIQEQQSGQMIQRGMSNALGIAPGLKFSFTNFPRQDQNTDQFTTTMILRITTADFSTADSNQASFSSTCEFTSLVATRPFRPARTTPKPRIPGPQTASVVGAPDSEVDADGYGNIIVQFHWDRQGQNNQDSSCRIRVSQNSAGPDWGSMFIPHIGNEVIVSFEDGDPDRPIVTGRVYNAEEMPPVSPTSSPLVSYIKDSSQQNLLSMDATANAQKLVVQNVKNKITMDSTAGAEKMVLTDGKSSMTFDTPAGNVTITNFKDVSTKTSGKSEILTLGAANKVVVGISNNVYVGGYTSSTLGINMGFVALIKSQIVLGAELKYNAGNKTELYTGTIYKIIWGSEYKWESKGKKRLSTDCGEVYSKWNILANTRNAIAISEARKTATFTADYGSKTEKIATTQSTTVLGSSTETVSASKTINASFLTLNAYATLTLKVGAVSATAAAAGYNVRAPIIALN